MDLKIIFTIILLLGVLVESIFSCKPCKRPSSRSKRMENRTLSDWQVERTRLVRERYEAMRMISNPPFYGLTKKDADEFKNRILTMQKENFQMNCERKKLSVQTQCTIQFISNLLKNTKCPRVPSSSPTLQHRRVRRRRETIMRNQDGSATTTLTCFRRGSRTRSGNLRLCTECHAMTRLPENVFPRYINEVICSTSDNSCLSSTGSCTEGILTIPFRRDTKNLGIERLGEWSEYQQPIRASCACGVRRTSPLRYFV